MLEDRGAKVDWLARTRAGMATSLTPKFDSLKPLPARRHSLDIVTGRRTSRASFSMKRTNEWVLTTDVPSDVVVEAGGMNFSLHKFPLVARSGRIRKLVASLADSDNPNLLQLTDVPGGAEAFDLAAKFCYGINFEITTSNVAVLRCAAESLEMTESYGENNLVARTESFLSEVVLQSLADSIAVLHNCENLLPLAEDLGIVSRCIEAAATKACRELNTNAIGRAEYGGSGRSENFKLSTSSNLPHSEGDRVTEEHGDLVFPQQKPCPNICLPDVLFACASSPAISSTPAYHRALVSGPPGCGKTSLLLQFAYNCARQDPSSFVTFLCKPYSLDDNSPCLFQGVDMESDAFSRITIKYIHDDQELRKYFAAFHLQKRFPTAVIIDDFYDLFDERSCAERFGHIRPRESAMVKTLALCYDAISFASANGGNEAQCRLFVSDSCVGETPRLLFIYQRWVLQIMTIEALGDSTFCVFLGKDDVGPSSKAVLAKYSFLQGRLHLDCIKGHD